MFTFDDLTKLDAFTTSLLTNDEVLDIDQDSLGKQATRAYVDGEVEVWTRPLAGGAEAVAVLNAGSDHVATHPFHLSLAKLGLHGPQKGKDLWTGQDVTLTENQAIELKSHDILLVRIAAAK